MRLTDLIHKPGKAGNWRSEDSLEYPYPVGMGRRIRTIYHYNTVMMEISITEDKPWRKLIHYHVGWGSRSDQDGMNKLFKEMKLPLYYSRKGGAQITITGENAK